MRRRREGVVVTQAGSEHVPFCVTLARAVGVADLDDNDNNHSLGLDVVGTALSAAFPAGQVVDPRGDVNPYTEVAVTRQALG